MNVVSYVEKLSELTSSSLIFGAEQQEEVTEAKDKRLDSHENRNHGGYALSEETKQNWTQEMLEDSKLLSFTNWAKKYNKSNTLYYKLKRL